MTKRQEFTVVRTYSNFEMREYQPCVIAEVKVSGQYSTAGSQAFRHLFQYISQGNKRSQKIAMTAPVIAAQHTDHSNSDDWHISFVMPAGSTYEQMPHPNDPEVTLRALDTQMCVALSFRGRATQEKSINSSKNSEQLQRRKTSHSPVRQESAALIRPLNQASCNITRL